MLHPVVGPLQLNREKVQIDDLMLVVYYPAAGSASAERLQLLASLSGRA
ncbi:hypothetical protein [Frondihabitans sp. PAMC 28766]|nr:hypothetical protein [Frondihabitans sp. PAMC 28766]